MDIIKNKYYNTINFDFHVEVQKDKLKIGKYKPKGMTWNYDAKSFFFTKRRKKMDSSNANIKKIR